MKRFTLASAAIAVALTASAQWNKDNTPVQIGTAVGTDSPIAALTSDGKMYVSWRSAAKVGNALCYSFPHLQLLDKDGNVLFGEKGLDISDHKSPSWNSTYSLAVTPDGCAIVSNADSRAEETEDLNKYSAFTPVWYRIDQNQEYLWGLDGLALTDRISSPFTDTFVIGDDVWIQDQTKSDSEDSYFNRVSSDGTLEFKEPLKIFGQVIQSNGSDFLTVKSGSNGVEVQRYTRDGKSVWTEPAVVSSTIFDGHDLHPYKVLSDGKGGVYITYVRSVGNFGHTIATQHVTADGDPTFGLDAMDALSDENIDINYPKTAIDTKGNVALVTFAQSIGSGSYAIMAQKFNEDGDRLFGDEAKQIDIKTGDGSGYAYNNYGAVSVGNDEWLICYSDVIGWGSENLYVARLDKDANIVWKQQIAEDGEINNVNFLKGDGCSYVVYKRIDEDDEGIEYGILKGARIYDDGTFAPKDPTGIEKVSDSMSEVTSTTIRSIDGKLVQTVTGNKYDSASLAKGMYIVTVKDAQGRTKNMKISK